MTIHKRSKKELFKLFIGAMFLFLSIITVMTCLNKTEKTNGNKKNVQGKDTKIKNEEQIPKKSKLTTKIAFEKNNNVYLYDEITGQIKSLGDNSKSKDLLTLSPDKKKVAFRYFNEGKAEYPPQVIIYDIQTENLTTIVIDNKNVQQVIDLKWVDNENILFTGHINPSSSGYAIYNIKSKIELISCVGTIKDVNINKKNILYSNTPHIFPQPKANLYINDNRIFEVEDGNEEIFDGAISEDCKLIVFRSGEKNLNSEAIAYINVAKINDDGKSISDLKKISISSDITGEIKIDGKNNISIISDEFIYKLKSGILIKEENILPKQVDISDDQIVRFKEILAKQFPEDVISEQTFLEDIGIYNMVAF